MTIAIVGGGIAGLALGLNLHKRGIACQIYEAAPQIKELGVGITLLPHGMRELTALGLQDQLKAVAIEIRESSFFNRFGQLIYKEPRGKLAGYSVPELGIHRGRLHSILYEAACARLGKDKITLDRRCIGLDQNDGGVTLHFEEASTGARAESVHAELVIGCDGFNSVVRGHFYPDEQVAFTGINTWRGVTRRKRILDGRTYIRIGSIRTGKMVIYPIIDDVDGHGNQLINWVAELQCETTERNDWNKPGKLDDFYPVYQDRRFDWLDVGELIRNADSIFEYPMVDRDPVETWTFGRVTLAGDAAHPMYPRGSNGSAQALIDVRTVADLLSQTDDPVAALGAYEQARLKPTSDVVRANRENPPDFINDTVERLTGDKPFDQLDAIITQEQLRALSDQYKRIAGFGLQDVR